MAAREQILSRLPARTAGGAPSEIRPPGKRERDELPAVFAAALRAAGGEPFVVAGEEAALDVLDRLLPERAGAGVAVNGDQPLAVARLRGRWPHLDWRPVVAGDPAQRDFIAAAEVGLSGAEMALAETGTVVLHSGHDRSRLATLLPPLHIALVSRRLLVGDLFAWAEATPSPFPSNVVLVSGPSKSADIEQTLTIGVHGPRRLAVILYDDGRTQGSP